MIYWRFSRKYLLHVNVAVLDAFDTIRRGRTIVAKLSWDRLPMRETDWKMCLKETVVCLDGDAKEILQVALAEHWK